MVCQLLIILLLLITGGCGISADSAWDAHTEFKTTFQNVSSVVAGNVVCGAEGYRVRMGSNNSNVSYLNGNFYFEKVTVSVVTAGVPVSARLDSGEELWSFLEGTPTKANVTVIEYDDWHGVSGTALDVRTVNGQEMPPESFVSINPFTNLAFRLSNPKFYSEFKNQLVSLNGIFFDKPLAPGCRADKGLCPEQRQFLDAGNSFRVSNDGLNFYFTTPGFKTCEGFISGFPAPCFKEISSARGKRL